MIAKLEQSIAPYNHSMHEAPPTAGSPKTPLATRGMWLIATVLAIGALSLATAALPGRARPLFLLPLAFGVASAGISIALSRSLHLARSTPVWLVTTALALGGYGQVTASGFRQFQAASGSGTEANQQALLALQMLKGSEHKDLADQMERELDARRSDWDRYLAHRYSALGKLDPRSAAPAFAVEVLLVIAGVAIGRRMLDARKPACHSGTL
ncbi:hypothetical protein [Caulifigura coniformis]|nr:hypothetical protein [Caulifigura coniformis]